MDRALPPKIEDDLITAALSQNETLSAENRRLQAALDAAQAKVKAIEQVLDIDSGKTTLEKVVDLKQSFKQVWDSYQDAATEMFKAQDALAQAQAKVQALEQRLEIDYAYNIDGEKIPCPPNMPDGIECRDVTIKCLEDDLKQERTRREAVEQELAEAIESDDRHFAMFESVNRMLNEERSWAAATRKDAEQLVQMSNGRAVVDTSHDQLQEALRLVRALPKLTNIQHVKSTLEPSEDPRDDIRSAELDIVLLDSQLADALTALLRYRATLDDAPVGKEEHGTV